MPLALDKVHVYARHVDPMTGDVTQRLVEHNPFLRLSNGVTEAPLYIQGGGVYGEGGDEVPEAMWPDWFTVALGTCTDQALIAVGWKQAAPEHRPLSQQPIVYTEEKTELLAALASMSEEQLRALLGPQTPVVPHGTPETPIADLDADDFPADPPDELLPPIPGAPGPPASEWQCEECGESVENRLKGVHIANHARRKKERHGEPAIQSGSEELRAGERLRAD